MVDANFSLIKLDGVGELGKTLIEKVSNAVGWVCNGSTPNRIAVHTFIEEIQRSDYDPFTKAALISNAKKIVLEYTNQIRILSIACNHLNPTALPSDIENDWLLMFMDRARLVSDSDFQKIWGRILAEECNKPNSIPRSLLHTLDQMDRVDAEGFTQLCSFSILAKDEGEFLYAPIIIEKHLSDYYKEKGITFDALVNLQALGLIEVSTGFLNPEYVFTCQSQPNEVVYFDKRYIVPEDIKTLPIGNVLLTRTGQALCRAIEPEEQEGFFDSYVIPYINEKIEQIREKQKNETD